MKSDVLKHVQSCSTCIQAKPDRPSSYPRLLQPLPVPTATWDVISMDFIEGLPQSGSSNAILVVVDRYSKYVHFMPLRHPFQAAGVANLFMDNVYKLHGLPSVIILDRDRIFTSKFWQSLFKLAGTSLHMILAYHLQTDGQTEHVNQCLETFLRCFVNACPARWTHWRSTGITPVVILRLGDSHSRSSTAFLRATWVCLQLPPLCRSCLRGWKNVS